jgi:hypothetical protein
LLNVQNDFLSVWVDHEVQQLNLDFDLGVMELDARGVRIEHNQPLRTFLTNLPCTAPCEDPDACAFLNAEMADMNQPLASPHMPGEAGPAFPLLEPMPKSEIELLPPPAENSGEKPAMK